MELLSDESIFKFPLIVLWLVLIIFKKTRKVFLLLPLFLFINNTLNHFIKITVKKPRAVQSTTYAFPSAHAMNSSMVASYLFFFYRSSVYFTAPIVSGIAYSRIYLGVHDVVDVIGGVVIGILMGFVFYIVAGYLKVYIK